MATNRPPPRLRALDWHQQLGAGCLTTMDEEKETLEHVEMHSSLPTEFGWKSRTKPPLQTPRNQNQNRGKHNFNRSEPVDVGKRHFKPSMLHDPWKRILDGAVRIGLDGMNVFKAYEPRLKPADGQEKANGHGTDARVLQNPDEIELDSD